MLRCTIAGLIPLMNSKKYSAYNDQFLKNSRSGFEHLVNHESLWVIKEFPKKVSMELLSPIVPALLAKQRKNGFWKIKDSEKYTYHLLSALKQSGLFDDYYKKGKFKYDIIEELEDKNDIYSTLIKLNVFEMNDKKTSESATGYINSIIKYQNTDGSWDNTVVSTVVNLRNLLLLKTGANDNAIKKGVDFLFENFNEKVTIDNKNAPEDFMVKSMFTTIDNYSEWKSAELLMPEWIPRHVCFRHLPVIQNSVCLKLLIDLGYEKDKRVESALDNLYRLYEEFGGLCSADVNKNPQRDRK